MRTLLTALMLATAPALAQETHAAQPTPPPPPPTVALDAAAQPTAAVQAPEGATRKIRIYMTDGQELTATLVGENTEKLRVRIGSGAPFDIARASIRNYEDADAPASQENFFRDPNSTRTFYAPTGFRMRQGEAYFSQKELLFSSFGYGITDNVAVMIGSVIPTWFGTGGQNVIVGFKAGADVGDMLHLAAGAQGFTLPFSSGFSGGGFPPSFAFVFGTATYGTPMANITLSAGEGVHNFFGSPNNTPIFVGSGYMRVSQNVALETENWFFPSIPAPFSSGGEPFLMLNTAGVRLMSKSLAADLGFIRMPGSLIPIPWVDFTYSFGG